MTDRITTLLLRIGLLLSALVAIFFLIRMLLGSFLPIEWYWGGALAAMAGPPAFAAALRWQAVR